MHGAKRALRLAFPRALYPRALALGAAATLSWLKADGETVTWEFAGLHDLGELLEDDLGDGVEAYSWRTESRGEGAVLPKERLAVFWEAANAHRTARELLDEHCDRAL